MTQPHYVNYISIESFWDLPTADLMRLLGREAEDILTVSELQALENPRRRKDPGISEKIRMKYRKALVEKLRREGRLDPDWLTLLDDPAFQFFSINFPVQQALNEYQRYIRRVR